MYVFARKSQDDIHILLYVCLLLRFTDRSSGNADLSSGSVVVSRFVKMEDFSAHLQSLHKDSDLLFLEEYEVRNSER